MALCVPGSEEWAAGLWSSKVLPYCLREGGLSGAPLCGPFVHDTGGTVSYSS